MTRSYWLVDGEEITTSFSCEGNIVFSMDELYYNKLSEEFVESLEDMEVYEISLSHLTHLFRTNIEWANWGRVIHQDEYRRLHRTHKERLTLPAKERYEQMKIQFPAVCERANLGYPIWELLFPHSAASEVTKKSPEKKTACIQED